MLSKIIKIVATRCYISRLKCTKFDFGWGSAPDPAGGAYTAFPLGPLAVLRDPSSKGREGRGRKEGEGRGIKEGTVEAGGEKGRSVLDLPLKYMVNLPLCVLHVQPPEGLIKSPRSRFLATSRQ